MTNLLDPEKVDMFGSRSILAYNWFEHKARNVCWPIQSVGLISSHLQFQIGHIESKGQVKESIKAACLQLR
jgi:hypothetical protein